MAIDRIAVHGGEERDLGWGVHVDGREVVSSPALYLWGIAPWGGADGEGDGTSPRPCLLHIAGSVFSCE